MLTDLTDLEAEHRTILSQLEQARALGPGSQEARQLLLQLKRGLMAHVQREETTLLAVLDRAAARHESAQQALRWFSVHRTLSTEAVLAVYERIERPASDLEYARDFGGLISLIRNRIEREEEILYPAYRGLMEQHTRRGRAAERR